tara:strand:- start:13 stop:282 length:270 start_codon:yes stop_codon:yes gene_type:complete
MTLKRTSKFVNTTISHFTENKNAEIDIVPVDLVDYLTLAAINSIDLDSHKDAFFALWEFDYIGKGVVKQLIKYFTNLITTRLSEINTHS